VSKKLRLDEAVGQAGAVDGDERPGLPAAACVDGAGGELLAGAAFAGDEHRDVGGGDFGERLGDLAHARAGAGKYIGAGAAFEALAQLGIFGDERLAVECLLDGLGQRRGVDRFGQVFAGALVDCLDGGFDRAAASAEDELGVARERLDLPHEGDDVDLTGLEALDDEVDGLGLYEALDMGRRAGAQDAVPDVLQNLCKRGEVAGVAVEDDDGDLGRIHGMVRA
jgi:hypothetical protein